MLTKLRPTSDTGLGLQYMLHCFVDCLSSLLFDHFACACVFEAINTDCALSVMMSRVFYKVRNSFSNIGSLPLQYTGCP